MLRRITTLFAPTLLAPAVLAAGLMASAPVAAHEYELGELHIDHPWTRALPPVSKNAAFYLTVSNAGAEADRLLAAETPAAERVEIHETSQDAEGVMRMREQDYAEIPAGGSLALEPNGYHLMVMNLKEPLEEGDRLPLTLTFERAGEIEVEVAVEAMGGASAHDHSGMDHGDADHGDMNHEDGQDGHGDHDHGGHDHGQDGDHHQ